MNWLHLYRNARLAGRLVQQNEKNRQTAEEYARTFGHVECMRCGNTGELAYRAVIAGPMNEKNLVCSRCGSTDWRKPTARPRSEPLAVEPAAIPAALQAKLEVAERRVRAEPLNAGMILQLATLQRGVSLEKALVNLHMVVQLEPSNSVAHATLAEIYESGGTFARAVEHGEDAVRFGPSLENRLRLGRCLIGANGRRAAEGAALLAECAKERGIDATTRRDALARAFEYYNGHRPDPSRYDQTTARTALEYARAGGAENLDALLCAARNAKGDEQLAIYKTAHARALVLRGDHADLRLEYAKACVGGSGDSDAGVAPASYAKVLGRLELAAQLLTGVPWASVPGEGVSVALATAVVLARPSPDTAEALVRLTQANPHRDRKQIRLSRQVLGQVELRRAVIEAEKKRWYRALRHWRRARWSGARRTERRQVLLDFPEMESARTKRTVLLAMVAVATIALAVLGLRGPLTEGGSSSPETSTPVDQQLSQPPAAAAAEPIDYESRASTRTPHKRRSPRRPASSSGQNEPLQSSTMGVVTPREAVMIQACTDKWIHCPEATADEHDVCNAAFETCKKAAHGRVDP